MNEWLLAYGSYLLIPFIAALAGWGTNWLAIKMTFYPLQYVGKYPFGWRGVVPSRTSKFASGMVDTTKKLVFQVFQVVEMEIREGVDGFAQDIRDQFGRLPDLKKLVVSKCEEHPDLLNQLAFACASRELSFLVGSMTNWIAIQLIFSPLEPKKIGPWVAQGLYLKWQKEISEEFSRVFTEDLLTAEAVVQTMMHGERRERSLAMLRSHISQIMEDRLIVQLITQAEGMGKADDHGVNLQLRVSQFGGRGRCQVAVTPA